jgi:hypothetical protein
MSSPTSPPMSARELYLLQQRAETFRVELELERQLRLQGIATLPVEWSDYLEHQRQIILDKIRMAQEPRENDLPSSLGMADVTHPTHNLPPTLPVLGPAVSPTQPEESIYPFVLPENEGTLTFALIPMSYLTDSQTMYAHRLIQTQPPSARMVHPPQKHIHFPIPSPRPYMVTRTPLHLPMSAFANPLQSRRDPHPLIMKTRVVTIHFEMGAHAAVRIRGG